MYAELHAHSAFSFLDGASLPDELAAAAAALGYGAFALTDHNGVSGSMEFAQAAKARGLKALHGAEIDLEGPGASAPPHPAGRHAGGLAQPLPHPHARARALAREGRAAARRAAGDARGARRRAGVPQRLRPPRRARRADAAPAARRLRARRPARRAAAAVPARRPRAQPRAGRPRRAARGARGRHGRRPRARARRARRCRTPSSPCATTRRSTRRSRCGAATRRTCSPLRRPWPRASRTIPPR